MFTPFRLPLLLVALSTQTAFADGDPIAVVTMDAHFRTAIGDALAPAGMSILPIAMTEPPALVAIAEASRAIADSARATATVWLLPSSDRGTTLVAYDRDVDRVLVRELPFAPPLDEAQAAQAARMARTMLRALRVTPDTDQLPPRATEAPVVRERVRVLTTSEQTATLASRPPAVLAAELEAGVRGRGPGAQVGFVGGLQITWRPDQLGIALAVRVSPGHALGDVGLRFDPPRDVTGRVRDVSLALLARIPFMLARRWTLAPAAGVALHRVTLDGDVSGMDVSKSALDPAVRAGVAATTHLGADVRVGLAMWADFLLRRQVYEVEERPILTVPFAQWTVGVVINRRFL